MNAVPTTDVLYERLHSRLAAHGQAHVLRWWPELSAVERERLARQIDEADLALLDRLFVEETVPAAPPLSDLLPPPLLRQPETFEDWEAQERAREIGERELGEGRVAACMAAGGQGTRLGLAGPKGMVEIGPISRRSLFQIHAEKVLALGRRHQVAIPFCIMTGPENDSATRAFFAAHDNFGLAPDQLLFFVQETLPALDAAAGKLLLADRGLLAVSPNGHGGMLQALERSGLLAELASRGIRQLLFFQVDNPLVQVADAAFVGRHVLAGSEFSLKVVPKLHPAEKMGVVVRAAGVTRILEYTELPLPLAEQRNADGTLTFAAGNIAVYLFDVGFLRRIASSPRPLPYHRALKKVPYVDDAGRCTQPAEPNALKFEMFIFDLLPLARKTLVVETTRREEFAPLKNAEGEHSLESVRLALTCVYADWLRQAGVEVERDAGGLPRHAIEISPLFALDAAELCGKVRGLEAPTGPMLLEPGRLDLREPIEEENPCASSS